ncbi:MAG TPA: hypothetical protein VMZ03_05135 [Chitinophagaceae bacterium]|nr:hypothetical protein [Chitinophagaceae bacterium]
MPFQKTDLVCDHYQQHDEGTLTFHGQPSRRAFDRLNSSQVLFVINYFAAGIENFTIEDLKDIEMLIATHLPIGNLSEISVINWIRTSAAKHLNTETKER